MITELRKKILKETFNFIIIIFFGILFALSYTLYVIPNNFAPAGLNGIAVMIQYKLNFSVGYMSLLINIPLCILAFFVINKKFAIKTFCFCIVYTISYLIFAKLDLEKFKYYSNDIDTIYPVLLSGLISGFAYGILFKMNGCTGGTDIVSKVVEKIKPEFNFFWITFFLNAIVALASYFVYAKETGGVITYNYKPVCLCLIYCFISSFTGNRIISGSKKAYKFIIITEHAEIIEKEITEKLKHSSTRINGIGSYSHSNKEVLISVVNKHQLVDFENILKKYDNTFAFIETTNNIIGNFKKIK